MHILRGIPASNGIAMAKAYCFGQQDLSFQQKIISDVDLEVERFHAAVAASKAELENIRKRASTEMGEDNASIFASHLLALSDPEFIAPIVEKIKMQHMNAEQALKEIGDYFIAVFEKMDNEYMSERAADIRDVTKRVLSHLIGAQNTDYSMISEEVIIISDDLTPSETAQLKRKFVKGYITNIGGRTSHSAIIARSMEIPAVVGTGTATAEIKNGDFLIIDGFKGEILINPTQDTIVHYEKEHSRFLKRKEEWAKLVNRKTTTADGYRIELEGNIGTHKDLDNVIKNGGEAIGLYRTEFLYMGRKTLPSEEEQLHVFKEVLEGMEGKPVIVRTLDIGGDKEIPNLNLPKEMNPFLGFRAIRLCLEKQELFRTQLRALLKASQYGNLKVMFPMISNIEEFRQAKSMFEEEKKKLQNEGTAVRDDIELGIMVEIPSCALMADVFAKEVDFFSIGTNDLIQYTMAADRMNERVANLYQPCHPSVLRLIKMVIDGANREGKPVGLCGDMAEDENAVPLLIGLGLNKFSMNAASILRVRSHILSLSKKEMEVLVRAALQMSTASEVIEAVKKMTEKRSGI